MANKCEIIIDFSIVTPAAKSYCAQYAKIPLRAAKIREETKNLKYFQAYKALYDTHFEPFVVEIGGQEDLQSYHSINGPKWIFDCIAYFCKSRFFFTLAKITNFNALR